MEEQEKKRTIRLEAQSKEKILQHLIKIKSISDMLISIIDKEEIIDEELENAIDLVDEIQVQSEDLIQILFDVRDTSQV